MSKNEDPFGLNFSAPDVSVTDPFLDDLNYCISLIEKDENNQSLRRMYCRTFFAAVEGSLNYIKPLLRNFNESMIRPFATMVDNIGLEHEIRYLTDVVPVQEANLLLDVALRVNDAGGVKPSPSFTNFKPNFKFTFRMIDRIYKLDCSPNYKENKGWAALEQSVAVRNRITHPKSDHSHDISDDELKQIDAAQKWFLPFFDDALEQMGAAMVNLYFDISHCEDPQIQQALDQMQKLVLKHESSPKE
jgi:Fe-S-cluster containining protein